MGSIYEKNSGKKSRATVPLKAMCLFLSEKPESMAGLLHPTDVFNNVCQCASNLSTKEGDGQREHP